MAKSIKPTTKSNPNDVELKCITCGNVSNESEYYSSNSKFYSGIARIPCCKSCMEKLYQDYYEKYENSQCEFPEQKAIKRICMVFDVYYNESVYNSAVKTMHAKPNMSMVSSYFNIMSLTQYRRKTYDDTIEVKGYSEMIQPYEIRNKEQKIEQKTMKFFGAGFSYDDYEFLQEQYNDWTTRHECKTKAQEEVFKQICFTQLELLKANRENRETKDLTATLQKLLETGKLQPKQNSSDTLSDSQTFGTLIDMWENTRPLPDIDDELKDVDKIGMYVDVFFKGHLSKMMGIKNTFSTLYTKFMNKYTVNKPEYDGEDNSEVIFDAIFGDHDLKSEVAKGGD